MSNPLETLRELTRLERTHRRLLSKAEDARAQRDAAIVRAIEEGVTQTEIAKVTGLTVGRIAQLVPSAMKPRARATAPS